MLNFLAKARRAAWWLAPALLCLLIHYRGLLVWFQADDFAWLGQWHRIKDGSTIWEELFNPTVHGTLRPLSERAFFLVLSYWFPDDALPYRIIVFATQFANVALLAWLARRLTGSTAVGFWAALLWAVNPNLDTVMNWSSAYMQALCGLCLLGGFHMYLNWMETGRRRWYWLQWLVFLTGFLVLETMVVYPALLAAHALIVDRKRLRAILPMFAASAAYTAFHMWYAPKQVEGVYSMHFDGWMLVTLLRYIRIAVSPLRVGWNMLNHWAGNFPYVGVMAAALLAAGWLAWRRKEWRAAVFAAWFLFPLAPVLPLRHHVTHYYLTLPLIGLSMFGAWALVEAWRARTAWRWIAALLVTAFVFGGVRDARVRSRWFYDNSVSCREIIQCASAARRAFPSHILLLSGLSDDQFWRVFVDYGFQAFGIEDIYPAPDVQSIVIRRPDYPFIDTFFLDPPTLEAALEKRRAVILGYRPGECRNITTQYLRFWEADRRVHQRQ